MMTGHKIVACGVIAKHFVMTPTHHLISSHFVAKLNDCRVPRSCKNLTTDKLGTVSISLDVKGFQRSEEGIRRAGGEVGGGEARRFSWTSGG